MNAPEASRRTGSLLRDLVELYIPAASFVIMFLVFILQIFFRYIVRQPLQWAYEVTVSCSLWLVILGSPSAISPTILFLGMFIDTSVIQVVFVPLMIPIATRLGIDLVHFGLVCIFNMMIGLCTPPFGMLLFITSGISGTPLKNVIREIWRPIVVMLAVLALITYVPDTVLLLPNCCWISQRIALTLGARPAQGRALCFAG